MVRKSSLGFLRYGIFIPVLTLSDLGLFRILLGTVLVPLNDYELYGRFLLSWEKPPYPVVRHGDIRRYILLP